MKPYVPLVSEPDFTLRMAEMFRHATSTQGLFSALGSYWTEYYAGSEALANAVTGYVAALGGEYRKLLDSILRSNILDIPSREKLQVSLLVFSEEDADILEHNIVFRHTGVTDVQYLVSNLFEPEVVLERDVHFTIDEATGTVVFNVDIFNDSAIVGSTSRFDVYPNRKILFWGTDLVLSSQWIYERYGRFLYRKSDDSISYKWLVQALMFFYANTKSVKNIENVLNIMYGVPFAQRDGEVVKSITNVYPSEEIKEETDDGSYYCIETTFRTYYAYPSAKITVNVGDTLKRFQLLASFHTVDDYITRPDFWKSAPFPEDLVEGGSDSLSLELREGLLDNVLKYNMVYVNLVETYQTMDTYEQQLTEIRDLLKSSIPVYLYPVIGTTFRIYLEDKVLDDERNTDDNTPDNHDYHRFKGYTAFDSRVSTARLLYTGEASYSGFPVDAQDNLKDYGSYSKDYEAFLYSGSLTYGGAVENRHNVHREYNDAHAFNGIWTYDCTFKYQHSSDQEEFHVTSFRFGIRDEYYFPDSETLYFQPCYYNGSYVHNNSYAEGTDLGMSGHFSYGINFIPVFEISTGLSITTTDEVSLPDDEEFTFRQISRT